MSGGGEGPEVVHIVPASGGIHDYALVMATIAAREGIAAEIVTVAPARGGMRAGIALGLRIRRRRSRVAHVELGAADAVAAWAALVLAVLPGGPNVVLILHDPAVVVATLFPTRRRGSRLRKILRVREEVLKRTAQRVLLRLLVRRASAVVCLRPGVVVFGRACAHLPQPVYSDEWPAARRRAASGSARVGYVGYWGREKGLETLRDAAARLTPADGVILIVGGAPTDPTEPWSAALAATFDELGPHVERPGFIASDALDTFLDGLDAAVLPYWPDLPAASSGIVMRLMQRGIPLIASRTPALVAQLGVDGAVWVPPKDPAALAEALRDAAADPTALSQAADGARERARAGHGWEVVGDRLRRLLRSAGAVGAAADAGSA